jgi:hypothetical protein
MGKTLIISSKVREKLAGKQPPVTQDEIVQCFANRAGKLLFDEREQHQSDPPTRWFISETDYGRKLKIAFINTDQGVVIRTAYDPNSEEIRIYKKYGGWPV